MARMIDNRRKKSRRGLLLMLAAFGAYCLLTGLTFLVGGHPGQDLVLAKGATAILVFGLVCFLGCGLAWWYDNPTEYRRQLLTKRHSHHHHH